MSPPPSPRLAVIAPGVDLIEGLSALSAVDAWMTGAGYVDDAELRVAEGAGDSTTTVRGRYNLLSLAGPRGGPFTVTLGRLDEGAIRVIGGELVRARSAGVNVLIQPASRDARVPVVKNQGIATWATAAAASAARARADEHDVDEPTVEVGDWVEHFAFGLSEVVKAEGDRLHLRDAEGARRVREVALSMLRVSGPTETDGKRIFKLTRRTPG